MTSHLTLSDQSIQEADRQSAGREWVRGIEPPSPAWKAGALPLSYTRVAASPSCASSRQLRARFAVGARGFEPPTPCSQSRCPTRLRRVPRRPGQRRGENCLNVTYTALAMIGFRRVPPGTHLGAWSTDRAPVSPDVSGCWCTRRLPGRCSLGPHPRRRESVHAHRRPTVRSPHKGIQSPSGICRGRRLGASRDAG